MRSSDEEEKEKITEFGTIILDIREELHLDTPIFINTLVNLIGWSIPDDLDEEGMRDIIRAFHRVFVEIKKEKIKMKNERL